MGRSFPGDPDDNFLDAIGYAFEGEFDMWVVIFTLSIFIPSVLMLIFSFSKKVGMFKISAGFGIGLLMFDLALFISQNEWSDLFSFDDCNVSIGTWIGLFMFVCALFLVKKPKINANDKNSTATTEISEN